MLNGLASLIVSAGNDQHLGGRQEDVLGRFFICCQRIPLTPVDEMEGHGLLLLNK